MANKAIYYFKTSAKTGAPAKAVIKEFKKLKPPTIVDLLSFHSGEMNITIDEKDLPVFLERLAMNGVLIKEVKILVNF